MTGWDDKLSVGVEFIVVVPVWYGVPARVERRGVSSVVEQSVAAR